MDAETIIKTIVGKVNSTLSYYEEDYTSAKRTTDLANERCHSFEQYIEIRFNFEASKIPELSLLVEEFGGRLFSAVELEEGDKAKRKFKLATIRLIDPKLLVGEDETLKDELAKAKEILGGSKISFNNLKKKIKFKIE